MNWFTSDTHLGHWEIVEHCSRPFVSIEEHDRKLVANINYCVEPTDCLWILGDFCWTHPRVYKPRFRCQNIHLVKGNHDKAGMSLFGSAIDQGGITIDKTYIFLNHYPMRSWNAASHGAWHLHGHVHGRLRQLYEEEPWILALDVGVDGHAYQPWSFDEIRRYMEPRIAARKEHYAWHGEDHSPRATD